MEGRKRTQTSPLLECAELVLPWLTPVELASISLSCKSLRLVAASVTAARTSDAARGTESHPVPFLNPLSLPCPPYSFFLYLPSAVPAPRAPPRQPWPRRAHSRGPAAPSLRLTIVWDPLKRWCLCAGEAVPEGAYVCDYAGELLTTAEARRRQRGYDGSGAAAALLVVREHLPSGKACLRLNIDATAAGNVARFINHSCDGGNLSTQLVRKPGSLLPRLCFFASQHISSGHELTFSYGGPPPATALAKPCYCGAPCCSGSLPSDPT